MKGLVLALLFVSVILISGCINISPEQLALANPLVEQFLEEYPNARVTANYFSEERSAEILENITSECANPYMEAKDYYRVQIDDPDSGLRVIAWIDWDEKKIECAVKYGTGEEKEISKPGEEIKECKSHHSSKCYNGHVYWYDSCGNREEKKEYCEYDCDGGFCVNEEGCDEHHSFDCHNGHLYWFDSCGNIEEKKQACPNGCENGQCKEGECESHHDTVCHEGHVYWTDSCGNKEGKKEYCGHGCSEGACVEEEELICCESFGYGAEMVKCCETYEWTTAEECTVPEDFVGGGKAVVEDSYCENTCADSDGGRNYFEAGTATEGSQSLSDHCNPDGTLTEKYCENGEIKAETVECHEKFECDGSRCALRYYYEHLTLGEEATMFGLEDVRYIEVNGTNHEIGILGWSAECNGVYLEIDDSSTSPAEFLENVTYETGIENLSIEINDIECIALGTQETSVLISFVLTNE